MAAVTATLNRARPSEILLFYCATDQNVNLSRLTSSSQSTNTVVARREAESRETKIQYRVGSARGDDDHGKLGHGAPLRGTHPVLGADPVLPVKGLVKNPSCFGWVNWKDLVSLACIRRWAVGRC